MLKRIGFYLIGFSVGIVFVTFIFKKKGTEFCYMPNCRILKKLKNQKIDISPQAIQLFENKDLARKEIDRVFTDGNIDFSKSTPRSKPCKKYLINSETYSLTAKWCDSIVYIESFTKRNEF